MSALSALHFHNEDAAYAYVEARLWPEGPVCPKCGGVDRIGKLNGKSTRAGVYKCYTADLTGTPRQVHKAPKSGSTRLRASTHGNAKLAPTKAPALQPPEPLFLSGLSSRIWVKRSESRNLNRANRSQPRSRLDGFFRA